MNTTITKILAVALAATALSSGALAQTTLRLGHNQVEQHSYHLSAVYFAEQVAELSGGEVTINIIPGGALGQEDTLLQDVASGNLDMSISTTANASGLVPELGFMSVSYLFANGEHFAKSMVDAEFNEELDKLIEARSPGFARAATITPGARSVYSSFGPVNSLEDIAGKKIRVQASPVESEVWTILGALPVSIPFGDVYTGMQTGLIVAAENSPGSYILNKHNEVAPYFSLTEHQWPISIISISDATWETLDDGQREAIMEAGRRTADYGVAKTMEIDNGLLAEMEEKYGVTVARPDSAPFSEKLAEFQDKKAAELNAQPLLERIRALR